MSNNDLLWIIIFILCPPIFFCWLGFMGVCLFVGFFKQIMCYFVLPAAVIGGLCGLTAFNASELKEIAEGAAIVGILVLFIGSIASAGYIGELITKKFKS